MNNTKDALPPTMFPGIRSRNYGFEPTAEEMDKAREAARYMQNVYMTGYHVRTFDLSKPADVEAYCEARLKLYSKAKAAEVVIHKMEHMAVQSPEPKWVVHLEYSEYRFEKKDLLAEKEETDEQDKSTSPGGGG